MFQMIGAVWCDKCQQAKELFQERGLWDLIEYIDFESPQGKGIAAKLGVEKVPFFVEDGNLVLYVGEMLHLLTQEKIKQAYEGENQS